MAGEDYVKVWKKRIDSAKKTKEDWEKRCRVQELYNYWFGEQLTNPIDEFDNRRAQINKIHPEVRNNLPSLYFYRPYARLTTAPEVANDPGSEVDAQTSLLQDTANHLIRDPEVRFEEATQLAVKESHWAVGAVEAGYSAEFADAPNVDKPPLKEDEKTSLAGSGADTAYGEDDAADELAAPEATDPTYAAMLEELKQLKGQLKKEKFYVKYIPAKQLLVSVTDKAILEENDWIGYYEDVPLEDVKRSKAYKNLKNLKAATGDPERDKEADKYCEETGSTKSVRLYKIWDLRAKVQYVFAQGHEKCLLKRPYKRCPLKFLRFDVDPYHFFPRPPLLSKLGPQDEYNASREYLRKIRNGTVPRYTYDEDGIEVAHLQKLESGEMGTYVPRKNGAGGDVVTPIQQPSYSENAIQTLTLSDKEFADVGGASGDGRLPQTKTATQAKIAETKNQAQDSFERTLVAKWLSEIVKELVSLAIERMNLDRWVAINVPADSLYAQQISMDISQKFEKINANILANASAGVRWDVIIDIESLSPVSEEEKFQKLMGGLQTISAPPLARLFSVSPPLLKMFLDGLGIKSAKDQEIISGSMQRVVQMEMQLAAQSQNSSTGVSGQGAPGKPSGPSPGAPGPAPGGPQPGGPAGPGASAPKP